MAIRKVADNPGNKEYKVRRMIGPKEAAEMLALNVNNRNVNHGRVESYAAEMADGRWEYNPVDAIAFYEDGTLANGQHRLLAVIRSGATIDVDVAYNVKQTMRAKIDGGAPRNIANYMTMRGIKNAAAASAALGLVVRHDYRRIQDHRLFHTSMVDESLARYSGFDRSVEFGVSRCKGGRGIIPCSVICGVHYLIARNWGNEEADEFTDALVNGENLSQGSPIMVTRNRLINDRAFTRVRRLRQDVILALVLKAFKAHRNGLTIKMCVFKQDEAFPYLEDDYRVPQEVEVGEPASVAGIAMGSRTV